MALFKKKNYYIETWFERDRAYVSLYREGREKVILEFWDDDVYSLVEDGFLDPRNWLKSMIEYAKHLGLIKDKKGR